MSSPCDIYLEAARRGLRLEPAGDMLAVLPKGKCPPDFADVLRANKTALLAWLSQPPCPGHGVVPPADLPLAAVEPQPSICERELVIHYLARQTGNRTGPLAEWIFRREAYYYEGAGKTWDCASHAYAAARDALCWQLNRSETEVWELLAGFNEAASDL